MHCGIRYLLIPLAFLAACSGQYSYRAQEQVFEPERYGFKVGKSQTEISLSVSTHCSASTLLIDRFTDAALKAVVSDGTVSLRFIPVTMGSTKEELGENAFVLCAATQHHGFDTLRFMAHREDKKLPFSEVETAILSSEYGLDKAALIECARSKGLALATKEENASRQAGVRALPYLHRGPGVDEQDPSVKRLEDIFFQ